MLTPPELNELKEANTRFYRAFEGLSLDEMAELWIHDDEVRCVHPGWPCLCGWEQVRDGWARVFQSTRYLEFNVTGLLTWTERELGCVFCHENIVSFLEGRVVRTLVLATNVFRRSGGQWRMVHHHASPVLRNLPSEEAE